MNMTEYASPVLRAPSPASSIGTSYGEDQTSSSDQEDQISQAKFEEKWGERLQLKNPTPEELARDLDPLLPLPRNDYEKRVLFETILKSLRNTVKQLQDNELFEQTLLRESQAALTPQPTTNDIDSLMRSMMGSSTQVDASVLDGPWNQRPNGEGGARTKFAARPGDK